MGTVPVCAYKALGTYRYGKISTILIFISFYYIKTRDM
jgi:hypothetical protein